MPAPLLRLVRQIAPLSAGIALTALCLALKENFPFTHYPMYSNFSDQTFYVWLADSQGEPIAVQTLTGLRTGRIKKVYDKEIDKVRAAIRDRTGSAPRDRELTAAQRRIAGDPTLRWLYGASPPAARAALAAAAPLQLFQVDITLADGEVRESEPVLVGRIDVP